ncbi:MAG: hypothetical protein LBC13_02185 [Clostridiales bacterium]|jgi:hypothetical protein|nr:hypothetical protein [Clostridiales bacterium]
MTEKTENSLIREIKKEHSALLFIALWISYAFRGTYSVGAAIRTMPYVMTMPFEFSPVIIIFIHILTGLITAAVAILLLRFFHTLTIRTAGGRAFISRSNFTAVFSVALTASNLLTGAVFWACYAFPLMFPLASAVADLIIGTPLLICAYFYMKKAFIPPHLYSKVFLTLAVPFVLYHAVFLAEAFI